MITLLLFSTLSFAGELIKHTPGDDDDMFVRRSAKEIPVKIQRVNHLGNAANAVVAITRPDSDDLNLVVYLAKDSVTYDMLGPVKVCEAGEKMPALKKLEVKKEITVTCGTEGKADTTFTFKVTDKIEKKD